MEEKGRQLEDLKCSYDNLQKSKTELEHKNADIVENLNSSIQELKEENSAKGGEILFRFVYFCLQ
jgi:L-lactate utilization protein LutB